MDRHGDRHARQTRLAEVGAAGQERLAASEIAVHLGGLAAVVASRYLAGAGVARLRVGSADVAARARGVDPAVRIAVDDRLGEGGPVASPYGLRDPAADAVALGAHAALAALRRVLGVPA